MKTLESTIPTCHPGFRIHVHIFRQNINNSVIKGKKYKKHMIIWLLLLFIFITYLFLPLESDLRQSVPLLDSLLLIKNYGKGQETTA